MSAEYSQVVSTSKKAGVLTKHSISAGSFFGNWRKRHFVLAPPFLRYYEKTEGFPKGNILLNGNSSAKKGRPGNEFTVSAPPIVMQARAKARTDRATNQNEDDASRVAACCQPAMPVFGVSCESFASIDRFLSSGHRRPQRVG